MSRRPPSDPSWENDPVWQLLEQVPPLNADSRFAEKVVRAARLDQPPASRWKSFLTFKTVGLSGALTTVGVLAFILFSSEPHQGQPSSLSQKDSFAQIQDIAETEVLIVAADHLDQYSDRELATLAGF